MNSKHKLASALLAALLLAACGGSDINGTYAESDSALSIRFQSGKAYVTGLTSMKTDQGTYTVDGDKITIKGPHLSLTLTRNEDGSLHLEHIGGTLVKTKTDAGS